MAAKPSELEQLVAHHDAQLGTLNNRMGAVERKLDNQDKKLDDIITAVKVQQAKPTFDPRSTIGIVKDLGVVFAMVCAGILYLAAQNGATDIALLKEKVQQLLTRVDRMEALVLPQSWASTVKH